MQEGRIPERLEFVYFRAFEKRKVIAQFQSLTKSDSGRYPLPKGLTAALPEKEPGDPASKILSIAFDTAMGRSEVVKPSLENYAYAASTYAEQGRMDKAVFTWLAAGLHYTADFSRCAGDPNAGPCKSMREKMLSARSHPSFRPLGQLFGAKNPSPDMVAAFAKIKFDDHPAAFFKHVYVANILSARKDAQGWTAEDLGGVSPRPIDHFLKAMVANPYCANVYKDIGDYFLRGFEADKAWYMYDLGRELPESSEADNLRKLTAFEATLVEKLPLYFGITYGFKREKSGP